MPKNPRKDDWRIGMRAAGAICSFPLRELPKYIAKLAAQEAAIARLLEQSKQGFREDLDDISDLDEPESPT